MKSNTKIIFFLMSIGLIAALFSLPYVYSLLGESLNETRLELGLSKNIYNTIIVGQAAIISSISAIVGGLLYRRAGFSLPLLERVFGQRDKKLNLKSWFFWSISTGAAIGIAIIVGDYVFYQLGVSISLFETDLPPWWAGLLVAFSAGISEELLMRFLLMTLLTLILRKLFRMQQNTAVWSAIILAALVFGALHLPATAQIVELNSLVIARALLLNGIGGIAFGMLYWKKGLESAMAAHFLTDVIIHGVFPLFL